MLFLGYGVLWLCCSSNISRSLLAKIAELSPRRPSIGFGASCLGCFGLGARARLQHARIILHGVYAGVGVIAVGRPLR